MGNRYWDVFIAFTRAINLGFGGGPASIPLIQNEAVKRYKWMTDEEFADALAIGNALPAPIATKMAAYIGYKVAGWPGVFLALLGAIAPTFLLVIFLSHLILVYAHSPYLNAMLKGVRPVVVVLIAQTALLMGKKSFPNPVTWGIAAATALLLYFDVHPAIIIVAAMAFGYVVFGRVKTKG